MRGVTLIEVVVTLLALGLLTGLAAAAVGSLRRLPVEPWRTAVIRARDSAIRTGRPVVLNGDSGYRAFLLPDGRAIGRGLDPLTGEGTSAPR
jgi:prepilin-type N-terminal cleavage/methylation domain-containing protein